MADEKTTTENRQTGEVMPRSDHPWVNYDDPTVALNACSQAINVLLEHKADGTGDADEGVNWILLAIGGALEYEEKRSVWEDSDKWPAEAESERPESGDSGTDLVRDPHWCDAPADITISQVKAGTMRRSVIGLNSLLRDLERSDEDVTHESCWCSALGLIEQLMFDVDNWNLDSLSVKENQ